jgi:demethylmenaquinone methyltransferase/2-methoxy-6-polyprenyl-1,4-benzoquinol methylase
MSRTGSGPCREKRTAECKRTASTEAEAGHDLIGMERFRLGSVRELPVIQATNGEPVPPSSPLDSFDAGSPLPEGKAKQDLVRSMFDTIAPRYDLVNRLMTFGLDVSWRRKTVAMLGLSAGSSVLDVGCGTGDLARDLRGKGHSAIGIDLSLGMLRAARAGGAPLVQADAASIPIRDAAADGVVSGFAVRNFSDLPGVMSELGRVLRPGGTLALLEVGEPQNGLLGFGQRFWFTRVVPRLGALLSDAAAYRYLPRSVAYLPSFTEFEGLLGNAGFTDVRQHRLTGGVAQCVTAVRSAQEACS